MPEPGSIPVFTVAELEAIKHGAPVPAAELVAGGFAVAETEADRTPVFAAIHRRHAQAATLVLAGAGLVTEPVIRPEGKNFYGMHTPAHVDGLSAGYYQAHTTLPENRAAQSTLTIESYTLTVDEHGILQAMYAAGLATHAGRGVRVLETTIDGRRKTGLNQITDGRSPDSRWRFAACWGVTVVFPNGYDAKPDASAATLHVHEASTSGNDPMAALQYRRVILSRIKSHKYSVWLDGKRRGWWPRRAR